jgi:hypothetical protein
MHGGDASTAGTCRSSIVFGESFMRLRSNMNVSQCCAAQFFDARERRAATLGFHEINDA